LSIVVILFAVAVLFGLGMALWIVFFLSRDDPADRK
jgi:hypothetical protein